ncbi:MAG: hypothetical protein IJS20_11455 [Bacteroidales bacterium]|nr:hypothetical protein [Bacteroidales bacterium]
MDIMYAKNDYLERENERILANIKDVMRTCVPLNIYCGMEHDVWGIWLEVDEVKYLVNPILLVNSLFEDHFFYSLLKEYPTKSNSRKSVEIHKESFCYSWRFYSGVSKNALPIYINFQECVAKIKTCVETLYEVLSAGKPAAYDEFNSGLDFGIEELRIAVEQMSISAVMPNYYCKMSSEVKEDPFVFEIEGDEYKEQYTIGIGNRKYSTWLTQWDNNYDSIRYQFESIVHNMEATINLTFDMSDLVLKIKCISVVDEINKTKDGCGNTYKKYALVEIQPNEFIHGPTLKGYCNLEQTLKTLYEGLLTLALAHDVESKEDEYEPSQNEAYNMFKSPLIEQYITGMEGSWPKAEFRQVRVKRILTMEPDYDEVIFDSEGNPPIELEGEDGNIEELYDKEGKPFQIDGLKEWQEEIEPIVIEGAVGRTIESFDWKSYHERGLALAQKLRAKLSSDFDLWYRAPLEDNSGIIPKPILIYEQPIERKE